MDDPNLNGNQYPGVSSQQQQPPGNQGSIPQNQVPHFYGAAPAQQLLQASEAVFARLFEQQQIFANQLMAQQQEFMRHQQEMFSGAMASIQVQVPPNPELILDSLANNIKEFRFDPEDSITFAAWYARYDDLFLKDAVRLDDEAKVRLLMRKLGASEHERYVSFILPKLPKEFKFAETIEKLKTLFGTTESDVSKRYRCLQMSKQATEDYVTFACRINKACVEFELRKLSEEQFKCLSFVCGLKAEEDAEVRTRLLSKIEEKKDVTLEQLSEDCQRLLNLKRDTAMIESSSAAAVQQIKRKPQIKKHPSNPEAAEDEPGRRPNKPSSPCWFCGAMHFVRDCNYTEHTCSECGQVGHREGYCFIANKNKKSSDQRTSPGRYSANTVSVHSNFVNKNRRIVQAKLNGEGVTFLLDTGSDVSVVGLDTWEKIGKPPTTPAEEEISTASGDQLTLLFKFSCAVFIGGKQSKGQFFVVNDPIHLLGLDLLDEFGLLSAPINTYSSVASDTTQICCYPFSGERSSAFVSPDDQPTCQQPAQQMRRGEVNKQSFLSNHEEKPSRREIQLINSILAQPSVNQFIVYSEVNQTEAAIPTYPAISSKVAASAASPSGCFLPNCSM